MSAIILIARVEALLMLRDPSPIILVLAMPLVIMVFLAGGFVGGPAQSIPALALLFGFFGIPWLGISFFRDHGWNTWDRLRTSPVRSIEVLLGKALPFAALFLLQQLLVIVIGWAAFEMPWHGRFVLAMPLMVTIVASEVAIGLMLVAVCRTINQLNAIANLGALLLVGIGGALSLPSGQPGWVNAIAPASPVYWALKGYEALITPGHQSYDVLLPISILLSVAAACVAVTALLYRSDMRKTYFA